jgi:hypothetical protein
MFAVVFAIGLAGMAAAAPKEGKNTEIITVNCGAGDFDVLTKNSPVAFDAQGNVYVAKIFEEEFTGTITTNDGSEFTVSESSVSGSNGKGFKDRLTPCTFSDSFTDTFILDAETAEFFGVPAQYVGTEVTLEGEVDGTAWVLHAD